MKKKAIATLLVFIIAIGLLHPTARADIIGTLDYTVSTATVNLTASGTGSFVINIPKPDQPYAGVEFMVQLPDGVTITSVSYNLPGALTLFPQEAPYHPGRYGFSGYSRTNRYTIDAVCTINIEYKGSTQTAMTVQTATIWFVTDHNTDSLVSDYNTDITLKPYSGVPDPGDIGGDTPGESDTPGSGGGSDTPGGSGDTGGGSDTPTAEVPDMETPMTGLFPFVDVDTDHWFYGDVYYMWENGLMNGTSNTMFSPFTSLTRGMVVTVLYRIHSEPDVSELDMPFNDVANNWYFDAIKWAASNEIALGYGDGTFRPNVNVTREQMAAFIHRYAEFTEVDLPEEVEYEGFTDQAEITDYALGYVEALFRAYIIRGKENNKFDPKGNATRAEYAAMLHRYLEIVNQ
jgi:hypothetical protein